MGWCGSGVSPKAEFVHGAQLLTYNLRMEQAYWTAQSGDHTTAGRPHQVLGVRPSVHTAGSGIEGLGRTPHNEPPPGYTKIKYSWPWS